MEHALVDLHWLPVQDRINFGLMAYVYKALRGLVPQYIVDLLRLRQRNLHLRQLHDRLHLSDPRPAKDIGWRGFVYSVPRLSNALPLSLREVNPRGLPVEALRLIHKLGYG